MRTLLRNKIGCGQNHHGDPPVAGPARHAAGRLGDSPVGRSADPVPSDASGKERAYLSLMEVSHDVPSRRAFHRFSWTGPHYSSG